MLTSVQREPVLLIREKDGPPAGLLLRKPTRLLHVHAADKALSIAVGDFKIDGRRVTYVGKATLPGLMETDVFPETKTEKSIDRHTDGERYLHFSEGSYFHELQLRFDYETEEPLPAGLELLDDALPDLSAIMLPRLASKLASGESVNVVLLGDSISRGANAVERPPYFDQFADALGQIGGSAITRHNLSVGGKTAAWGVTQREAAAALKPDLFIVAFGMNDASQKRETADFMADIEAIIATVREQNPTAETIVVSGMNANAHWAYSGPKQHADYHEALLKLSQREHGIAFADVYTPWNLIEARKGFLSITGNGVNHPNDYGHRLYALALWRALRG